MSRNRVGLGRRGEELVAREMLRRGYEIIARNWRCAEGEVDIVAHHGGMWAFVEVRTRRGSDYGTPEESLTEAKQARMAAVAECYLAEHDVGEVDWRLDLAVVEMDCSGRLLRLDIVENAVEGW